MFALLFAFSLLTSTIVEDVPILDSDPVIEESLDVENDGDEVIDENNNYVVSDDNLSIDGTQMSSLLTTSSGDTFDDTNIVNAITSLQSSIDTFYKTSRAFYDFKCPLVTETFDDGAELFLVGVAHENTYVVFDESYNVIGCTTFSKIRDLDYSYGYSNQPFDEIFDYYDDYLGPSYLYRDIFNLPVFVPSEDEYLDYNYDVIYLDLTDYDALSYYKCTTFPSLVNESLNDIDENIDYVFQTLQRVTFVLNFFLDIYVLFWCLPKVRDFMRCIMLRKGEKKYD